MEDKLKKMRPTPDESKWKVESREILFENSWNKYVHDHGMTDQGRPYDYYFIHKTLSVGIVALTDKNEMIMVRQYRYLTMRDELAVPGGGSRDPIDPLELAKLELKEETGHEADHWEKIGDFDVANGHSNDIAHVFIARGCKKTGEQQLDDSEMGMTVEFHPVESIFEMVQDGQLKDSFTLSSLMLAWPHLL